MASVPVLLRAGWSLAVGCVCTATFALIGVWSPSTQPSASAAYQDRASGFCWSERSSPLRSEVLVKDVGSSFVSWSPDVGSVALAYETEAHGAEERDLPDWARGTRDRLDAIRSGLGHLRSPGSFGEQAFGWPARSFVLTWRADYGRPVITDGLPLTVGSSSVPGLANAVLPMHVLWGGMLVNAGLWGLLAAAAGFGTNRLLRRIRLMRGLCPQCGYRQKGASSARCCECGCVVFRRVQSSMTTSSALHCCVWGGSMRTRT